MNELDGRFDRKGSPVPATEDLLLGGRIFLFSVFERMTCVRIDDENGNSSKEHTFDKSIFCLVRNLCHSHIGTCACTIADYSARNWLLCFTKCLHFVQWTTHVMSGGKAKRFNNKPIRHGQ